MMRKWIKMENRTHSHFKKNIRKIFWIVGILFCVNIALNTGIAVAGAPGIKIGIVTSLTGPLTGYGMQHLNGYKLWAENVNAKGGILGRRIELIVHDDGGQPEVGVMVAEKMAFRDDVDVIFGPFSSAVNYPLSSVVERFKIPMLSAGPVRSSIWQRDYKYIFMVFSPFEAFFSASINFAIEHNLKTAGLIVNDNSSNKIDIRKGLTMAKDKGLKIVSHQEVSPGDYDTVERFLREMNHIRPDMVVSATYPQDGQYFADILRKLRWRKTVWIDYFASSNEFYKKMLGDSDYVFGISQWEPEVPTSENKKFVHDYQKKFGELPDSISAAAYSSGILVEEAIKKARSIEKRKIRTELINLKMMTPFGFYEVDERGYQIGHKMVVTQMQRGKKVIVSPEEFSTSRAKLPL